MGVLANVMEVGPKTRPFQVQWTEDYPLTRDFSSEGSSQPCAP